MDETTRTLLIEIARTVLRVLESSGEKPKRAKAKPVAAIVQAPDSVSPNDADVTVGDLTYANAQATYTRKPSRGAAKAATTEGSERVETPVSHSQNNAAVDAGLAQRGSVVRVWTGDRYEVGTVKALCRLMREGEPRRVWVTIARAGKRNKKVRVLQTKCEVLP